MEPTLSPGTVVLVNSRAYVAASPAPGDVVVAEHPHSGIAIIKRVESVSDDGVFVRSDNSEDLDVSDSRIFGPLPPTHILGKVIAQVGSGLNN